MSSFLGAKGTCGFNLDLIKTPSPSSGCSSTLTKSSSISSFDIPTKRGRAPRKRPNQSYFEAATLLSTACPNVFSIKNLHKKHSGSFSSLSSSSLSSTGRPPSFPVLSDSDFLIEDPSPGPNLSRSFKFRPVNPIKTSCFVPRVGSPPGSPGYDVSSIFGDDDVEGIDSIMGKLSVNDCDANCSPSVDPCTHSFVGGKVGLRAHNDDWWRLMPMVNMKDIVPKLNAMPSLERKKKTKKKKLEEVMDESEATKTTTGSCITTSAGKREGNLKSCLDLKLNHEEVIEAWGDREFPISCDPGASEATSGIDTKLAMIDIFPDDEGVGMREASMLRYKEKRSSRLFAKKIRYQVRKLKADCKPRMKGRFVKSNQGRFLREAIKEENLLDLQSIRS